METLIQEGIKRQRLLLQESIVPLYKQQHKEPPKALQPKLKGQHEKENNLVMAVIQSNTGVLCLMALLMVSTTLLSSQALGRNIGTFFSTRVYCYREICGFWELDCDPIA